MQHFKQYKCDKYYISGGIYGQYNTINIGGVVGQPYGVSTVRNCVNYGNIIYNDYSYGYYIGGIAGGLYSSMSQNCINYGNIVYNGETENVGYIGGITGYISSDSADDNCVNVGGITFNSTKQVRIGAIVGELSYDSELHHCYWDSNIEYDAYSYAPQSSLVSNNSSFNNGFYFDENITIGIIWFFSY